VPLQDSAYFKAIHFRQARIEKYQVWMACLCGCEPGKIIAA